MRATSEMACCEERVCSSSPSTSEMCVYIAVSYIRLANQCVYNKMAEKWCRNKHGGRKPELRFGVRKVGGRTENWVGKRAVVAVSLWGGKEGNPRYN